MFLKCPVPNQEYVICYQIVHFDVSSICFWCTSVFLLFRCILLIVDVILSVLFCNPALFSLNWFILFEQRNTNVAFIYCSNYLISLHFQSALPTNSPQDKTLFCKEDSCSCSKTKASCKRILGKKNCIYVCQQFDNKTKNFQWENLNKSMTISFANAYTTSKKDNNKSIKNVSY